MYKTFTQRLVLAVALVAAAAGAQAAVTTPRDPYTDGARSVQEARDVFTEGAHSVQEPRSPYFDGAHTVAAVSSPRDPYTEGARAVQDARDVFSEGARSLAGLDRVGVSADPARNVDPYLDGAFA